MKVTNDLNLPQPFVDAAAGDYAYKEKRYSATDLTKGVREAVLLHRHGDEVEVDVARQVFAILGTAIHKVLEEANETASQIKEGKLAEELPNGYTLSGVFDLYDGETKTVTDYKTTGAFKVMIGNYDEWRKQLLIYAYLLRKAGFDVEHGQIVMIIRDHSKDKAERGQCPELPVVVKSYDFGERDIDEIGRFILDRFSQIEEAEKLPDDELPMCSPDERWVRDECYAVVNPNSKARKPRARKLFRVSEHGRDAERKAREYAAALGKGDSVVHRPGKDVKCLDYCSAAPFCSHYKKIIEEA